MPPCSGLCPLLGSVLRPVTTLLVGPLVYLAFLSVVPVPPTQARRRPARRTLTARVLTRGLSVLQVQGSPGRAKGTLGLMGGDLLCTASWNWQKW